MSGVIDPSLVVHAWFQTLRPCCNNLNKSLSGYQNHENLVKACNCTFDDGDVQWLIGSAPDFRGRCPGFESGFSHNDPDALQDHCVKEENLRKERENYPRNKKRSKNKTKLLAKARVQRHSRIIKIC